MKGPSVYRPVTTLAPLVSVAMITYNHRPYIAQALESVLAQRRDFPIEIVISDDCSADGTAAVIDEYQRKHPGLFRRLDPPRNVGMTANFGRVWPECKGKYIALLEGDDWWHSPDKLATQVEFMERHTQCTISGHLCECKNATGESVLTHGLTQQPEEFEAHDMITGRAVLMTPSVICRSGVVPRVPDWTNGMSFLDLPLFFLHAVRGRAGFINQPLATYRVHSGGVWSSKSSTGGLMCMIDGCKVMQSHSPSHMRHYFDARIAQAHHNLFLLYRSDRQPSKARWHLKQAMWHYGRAGRLTTGLALRAALWLMWPSAGRLGSK